MTEAERHKNRQLLSEELLMLQSVKRGVEREEGETAGFCFRRVARMDLSACLSTVHGDL